MKRSFAILLLVSMMMPGLASGKADSISSATLSRYRENEVMDYDGIRLDPAIGPRDNSINGVQYVDIEGFTLTVDGLVDREAVYTYGDVLALPAYERLVTLYCVEGWDATVLWKGALLQDLISASGAKASAVTVIFSSVDGYTTSLPLTVILEKQLILGYGANGLPLPPKWAIRLLLSRRIS